MATAADILHALDALAQRFEFPGFNNMNYETADARLHLFRSSDGWAILVEELVDWPGVGGLARLTFAMGDVRGEALSLSEIPDEPLDCLDDGTPIVPDTVRLRGAPIAVDRAGLAALVAEGVEPTFALLVQLAENHRDAMFSTPAELAGHVAPGLERVLTVEAWAHPDVYGGPAPSESEAFRQLAEVLATGEVGRYAPTERPNSQDWRHWLASR